MKKEIDLSRRELADNFAYHYQLPRCDPPRGLTRRHGVHGDFGGRRSTKSVVGFLGWRATRARILPRAPRVESVSTGLGRLESARVNGPETLFHLLLESRLLFGVRTKGEGMTPLEARVDFFPDPPERVAQMIVDGGIARYKKDRIFERLGRIIETAQLEISPADTVDDVSVEWFQSARLFE